jgi:outer membrane protein
VFQVVSSYLNILRNDQLVKVTEENLRRDQRQLERIVESNRVGALSLADVYRQQSQTAIDELSVINARNTYDKSKADLLALVGLDVYEEYSFVDPSIMGETDTLKMRATAQQYRDITSLTQRALQARPDYIGATENLNAAESQVTSARSSYMPSISASAGYTRYGDELKFSFRNSNLNWGLGLQWNLFDGFRTNENVQQAVATKRNAEITLSQAQKNIGVDVKKALLDLEAARKSLEVSQKGLVSAEEDRKIAEERYNLGAGTLLDLLVANANLVSAQANKVNATYGYVTARYNIEYVLGEKSL